MEIKIIQNDNVKRQCKPIHSIYFRRNARRRYFIYLFILPQLRPFRDIINF